MSIRPPKGLTPEQIDAAERFAAKTGIGPLFDLRPAHHGQHIWCEDCAKWRKRKKAKPRAAADQPWQPRTRDGADAA